MSEDCCMGMFTHVYDKDCSLTNEKPPTTDPFERHLNAIFEEARLLLLKKHHDYGPLNIARAPGGALNGLRVRVWDKLARINNLLDSGAEPENESLRDSWVDMLNYSAIALMCLDKEWPGVE